MLRHSCSSWLSRAVAGLVLAATAVSLHADDRVGVVRIRNGNAPTVRAQSAEIPLPPLPEAAPEAIQQTSDEVLQASAACNDSTPCETQQPCQQEICCEEPGLCWKLKAAGIIAAHKMALHTYDAGRMIGAHLPGDCQRRGCGNPNCKECREGRCRQPGGICDGWLRRKLAYFHCTGSCGQGTPLVGKYHMIYPVDPGYFDARDGQVYSSQVFNTPVSVPLAPVVHHTYNYGWGVPSSRLTPVSHPTPYAPAPLPVPYPAYGRF